MTIHRKPIQIVFFFLAFTLSLYPETVILKSGKSFYGSVIDQNRDFLKLKDKDGIIQQFARTDILKVTYKELNAKEVKKIVEVETKKNQTTPNPEIDSEEITNFDLNRENQTEDSLKKQPLRFQKKIHWGVVGRSAMLPGWGQYHSDEPFWGSLYLISFLGGVVHYQHAWNEHTKVKSEYQNDFRSILLLNSGNAGFALQLIDKYNLASDYRTTANSLNTASDILIGIFLINLIDAMLPRAGKTISADSLLDKKAGLHVKAEMVYGDQKYITTSVDYKIGYTWAF